MVLCARPSLFGRYFPATAEPDLVRTLGWTGQMRPTGQMRRMEPAGRLGGCRFGNDSISLGVSRRLAFSFEGFCGISGGATAGGASGRDSFASRASHSVSIPRYTGGEQSWVSDGSDFGLGAGWSSTRVFCGAGSLGARCFSLKFGRAGDHRGKVYTAARRPGARRASIVLRQHPGSLPPPISSPLMARAKIRSTMGS